MIRLHVIHMQYANTDTIFITGCRATQVQISREYYLSFFFFYDTKQKKLNHLLHLFLQTIYRLYL